MSDSTNVLALECALRRREQRREATHAQDMVRLCASHRFVRAQRYNAPNLRAHFGMFTSARAGGLGVGNFEAAALTEQLDFYLHFLGALERYGYQLADVRTSFTPGR